MTITHQKATMDHDPALTREQRLLALARLAPAFAALPQASFAVALPPACRSAARGFNGP
jgi:hypothetical protein